MPLTPREVFESQTTEHDEMAFKSFTKEIAVEQARYFSHAAVFAAKLGSLPATIEMCRKRRDEWMRVARGEIRHPFFA
jgi:hypothetical protein